MPTPRRAALFALVLALPAVPPAHACPAGKVIMPRTGPAAPPSSEALGSWSFPRSMEGVSGYNSDCRPTMSADGTRVLFESGQHAGPPYDPANHGAEHFYIYQMDWDGSQWADLRALDPDHFTDHNHPCISADGQRLFTTARGEVHVAEWNGSDWDAPVALAGVLNEGPGIVANGSVSVTTDQSEIYFASERATGLGDNDIWVCRLRGSFTDSLTNLGPGVNSAGSEVRPAISPDGSSLLFSDFEGGRPTLDFGETDLYLSEYSAGSWGLAAPLPAPINNDMPACTAHWVSATELLVGGGVCLGGAGGEDLWLSYAGGSEGLRNPVLAKAFDRGRQARRERMSRVADAAAAGAAPAIRPPGRWRRLANLPGARIVEDLVLLSSGTLLAATSDEGYVFRSTDEGATWNRIDLGPFAMRVYRLLERSTGSVLAGTYPAGRVFESSDDGLSWSSLAALPSWVHAVRGITELASGDLLVGVSPETLATMVSIGRLFRSTNDGASWSISGSLGQIAGGVWALHEMADGTIWAGGRAYSGKIYKSTDGGFAWQAVSPGYAHTPTLASVFQFVEDSSGRLWAAGWGHGGELGALLMKHEGGDTWSVDAPFRREQDGVEYADGSCFAMAESSSGLLMTGTAPSSGSPSWISEDRGLTWRPTSALEGARQMTALVALDGDRMIAGTCGDGAIWLWERTIEERAR